MSLTRNLILAEMAVKYANDALRGRSSNRSEDLMHTVQQNLRWTFRNSVDPKGALKEAMGNPFLIREKIDQVYQSRWPEIANAREERASHGTRLNAAAILADQVGNCFEHAVLACHFLNGKHVPCYIVDTDDNTNHCFVIVDAPAGLAGQTVDVTRGMVPPAIVNGGVAVVCDPWYHEWFGIQASWTVKMWQCFITATKYPPTPSPVPLTFTDGALVT